MTTELETVETVVGQGDPRWSVIWLHGLGADGHDFAPIVPELRREGWPTVRFVFPHAPVRPVTINGGMRMRAWYDIAHLDLANRADEAGLQESMAQAEALVAREVARGVPESRIILAGFSQGGAVTLALGMRRALPLAGLVALSTYLPAPDRAKAECRADGARPPVFMAHGLGDPVVPYLAGEMSADVLRECGFAVEWHAYPMMHAVMPQEISDLSDWFEARFRAG
ncbi:alpha/beta hydrolase [Solilutibacter silvestris]|uniref:alpha/beta hydrolase n=1 Tax=Solilutibacter silvestris TaxID=1645665 RepID=UPI003D34723C